MFPCTECGLCCKNINRNPLYASLDRGDGVCKNLVNDTSCSIYDDRPIFCRIDEAHKLFFSMLSLSEYYNLNAKTCYELQVSVGAPINKRINQFF
jgi:Fe-S-cluster containining protein